MSVPVRKPSRLLFCALVLVGVYPLVTALGYVSQPFTIGWQIWQRNLIVVPVMVLTMVYGLIPAINAALARRTNQSREDSTREQGAQT
jgi:antibiotic biosynthesis monooxygenase (ABM) superfamily enzyme